MKSIYFQLLNSLEKKEPVVLATIVETKGSSPQVPGASALFSSEGLIAGTLGGGWLEADAQKKAIATIDKGEPLLREFSLYADIDSGDGAICGGEIRILIDPRPDEHRDTFKELVRSLEQRRAGVLATFINRISEEKVQPLRYWIDEKERSKVSSVEHLSLFHGSIERAISESAPSLVKIEKSIFPARSEETLLFLEPIAPLPRLVIAGAGHIGQALTHIGSLLSFEVTVIDDRPEFAKRERLPDADHIILDDIGTALKNTPVSSDTYFVIVTRAHRQDAEALRQVITSDAAYIGMIGSKRKISIIRKKLLDQGWATPEQFDRVYAPIGIDIQSETVEEIAISIAAQLVQVRGKMKSKTTELK